MMKLSNLLLLATILMSCSSNARTSQSEVSQEDSTEYSVTLIFGGDLMQHQPQITAAKTATGYDYSDCFTLMKPEIERADLAIANFEVTLGGPPYKGYPQFCAPDEYLFAVQEAGFDVLTTCNNHSVDTYGRGIDRTILMMDSIGMPHLGTYRNQAERDAQYPFIIERNNIRICLLNYTYGTNGIRVPDPYIVNALDTAIIARDIQRARELNPDVIICMPHWGDEYHLLPNEGQKRLANWMFEHGVDHIIGGHPHVVEPIEVREGEDGRHLLAYSLGNYISNQSRPNTDGGTMVRITLTKRENKTTLTDCGYCLYYVSRPVNSGRKQYRVIPASYPDDQLNASERAKRATYLKTTRDLFAKHNKGIEEYLQEIDN